MRRKKGDFLTSVLSAYSEGWRRRRRRRIGTTEDPNTVDEDGDKAKKSFFREAKPKPRDEDTKNRYDVDNDELDL